MIKRMAEKMQTIHNSCFGIGQDHIKDVYDYINQLEADKLEAYRAIVDDCTAEWCGSGYCVHCEEFHSSGHKEDCIVLKAEKYISEVTK